jgi:glucose-6-phosphate 1-dehydrogenase
VSAPPIEPLLFIIFGGTGDLARRKLIPALWRLLVHDGLADRVAVLGVGTRERTDIEFREMARVSLLDSGADPEDADAWCATRLHYQVVGDGPESYGILADRITGLEQHHALGGNRAFYIALPPSVLEPTLAGMGRAGLGDGPGWTRLVIEKPFGRDLASARRLNDLVHACVDESQAYRIDHYLGKETVRNLLVFRFANALFERTWNRDHIESVEITVAETIGVGGREHYYDETGVVRDMIQNHLTQLLTLVAMEPPVEMGHDAIRSEKVKVLRSVVPPVPDDVVYGQYTAGFVGHEVHGYTDLPGIPADSTTSTFAAVRLNIENWRWQGVPFFLRAGKRLPERSSRILVRYRQPPVCLFHADCPGHENLLVLTLQPDEGFDLYFDVKVPGDELLITEVPLSVRYGDFADGITDAYQTLLRDVMEGDQTLFVRSDEVEEAWRIYAHILDTDSVDLYPAGTWGPPAANRLVEASGNVWSEVGLETELLDRHPTDA